MPNSLKDLFGLLLLAFSSDSAQKDEKESCTIFLIYRCTACVPSLQNNPGPFAFNKTPTRHNEANNKRLVCSSINLTLLAIKIIPRLFVLIAS
jgi:hypothetical protein